MKPSSAKKLKLHLDEYQMKLTPKSVVPGIPIGQDIAMRLNVSDYLTDFDYRSIIIRAKNSGDPQFEIDWDNSSAAELTFRMTGAASLGTDYEYFIEVPGIGTIDPIIRVVDFETFKSLREAALEQFGQEDLQPDPGAIA